MGVQAGAAAARGAVATASGQAFERELEATHDALVAQGEALVLTRGYPPIGGNPQDGFYLRGKGDVDFVGTWRGRPVAFDAKSEAGAASYRHLERDMHELDFLLAFRTRGLGWSFLLIRDAELGRVYLVGELSTLRAGGAVALRAHARDGAAARVPCLEVSEPQRLIASVLGRPVWDWTRLLDSRELHAPP